MHALVRTVFSRLHSLEPEEEEAKLMTNDEDTQEGEIRMTVSTSHVPDGKQGDDHSEDNEEDLSQEVAASAHEEPDEHPAPPTPTHIAPADRPDCTCTRLINVGDLVYSPLQMASLQFLSFFVSSLMSLIQMTNNTPILPV